MKKKILVLLIFGTMFPASANANDVSSGGVDTTADVIMSVDTDNNERGIFGVNIGSSYNYTSTATVPSVDFLVTETDIYLNHNTDVSGTLYISGTTTTNGTLDVNGGIQGENFTVANDTGNTSVGGTLVVTGTTTTNGINNGNDGITNTGAISGASTISASSTISTTGTVSALAADIGTGGLDVDGSTQLDGMTSDGNITVNSGGLDVTGATDLNSGLNVDGTSTLDSITAVGTLSQTGTTNINTTGSAATTIGNSNAATAVTATAGNSVLNLDNNDGSFLVDGHGLAVDGTNDVTTLTGGTNTSTLTLQDASTTLTVGGASGTAVTLIEATTNTDSSSPVITLGSRDADATVNNYGGAGYTTINNTNSTLGTGTGGMVQTSATTATIRASNSGALATNSLTGTMSINNGGGYTAYQSSQTIASSATIGNVLEGVQYTNQISGNLMVDGDVYINGTLNYVSSDAANTTVVNGGSVLSNATETTSGSTAIVMKDTNANHTVVDANGRLTNISGVATESSASLTLTNGYGETHGIIVTESQTTISGGTSSSSLTMDDNGATFSDASTGNPIQVHGVNDGTADFDAVNVRQFAGAIAATAALSQVPDVPVGQRGTFGFGGATFMGKTAVAAGMSYRFSDNGILKASTSVNNGSKQRPIVAIGAGWSW